MSTTTICQRCVGTGKVQSAQMFGEYLPCPDCHEQPYIGNAAPAIDAELKQPPTVAEILDRIETEFGLKGLGKVLWE